MEKKEFDKLLKIGGFDTKKEFANLFELNPKSVNNWGTSQNIPYWVESWLNNYIELKEIRDVIIDEMPINFQLLSKGKNYEDLSTSELLEFYKDKEYRKKNYKQEFIETEDGFVISSSKIEDLDKRLKKLEDKEDAPKNYNIKGI